MDVIGMLNACKNPIGDERNLGNHEVDAIVSEIERLKHDLASWKTRSAENAGRANKAEAERDEARALATRRGEIQVRQQAQLAEAHAALRRMFEFLPLEGEGREIVMKALATDAGKAAADVLAAADDLEHLMVRCKIGQEKGQKYLGAEAKLWGAVRACRKEGRDDG